MFQVIDRGFRGLGFFLFLFSVALASMGADCVPPWAITDGDCTPGLRLNGVYDVTLVDTYNADAPFVIDRVPDLGRLMSCRGSDGLAVGRTFRVRMTRRVQQPGGNGCGFYNATVISGIEGIDVSRTTFSSTFTSFSVATTNFTLLAHADRPAPFVNVRAARGRRPPLRVTRTTSTCGDVFVAQIFEVEESDAGAGVDALR